jgi:multidrug efflux pump subunit AcrA (membrane-fusion protein)
MHIKKLNIIIIIFSLITQVNILAITAKQLPKPTLILPENLPGTNAMPSNGASNGNGTCIINILTSNAQQATEQAADIATSVTQKTAQLQEQLQAQLQEQIQAQLQEQMATQITEQVQQQVQKQLQEQLQLQAQKQLQEQLQKQAQPSNWDKLQQSGLSTWNYLSNHKVMTGICLVGLIYAYSLYQLTQLEQQLEQPNNLGDWKADCNLNELLATDNLKLVQDLDQVIKNRYETSFKTEIERELTTAHKYLKICQRIKFWRLTRFYPTNEQKIKNIETRISRLNYLKGLFNSWQRSKIVN